jgi:hypothetical protein
MFGRIDTKVRPFRLACLVDPGDTAQLREAIRLNTTLWGGAYFPIIPLYKRMPNSWKDIVKVPSAQAVTTGYLEAFDPDALVQFAAELPTYVMDIKRPVIQPQDVWKRLEIDPLRAPLVGIGVFELLDGIFREHFRYKAKYPPKMRVPRIPSQLSLFWASVFGELPLNISRHVERDFVEPLEMTFVDFTPPQLAELMRGDHFFPRRWTMHGLKESGHRHEHHKARVLYMDATRPEDVVEYWNLRAMGGHVIPMPKQLLADVPFVDWLVTFLKDHRRHWSHNPQHCDRATIICSRSSSVDELQAYAKTLPLERPPDDPSTDGFFLLQKWYPRVWDEWARDKDGAVPFDHYSETEDSIEVNQPSVGTVRLKPLVPPFAADNSIYSEGRCANEIDFRFYGAAENLAEVFPRASGLHFSAAISGVASSDADWRVGRHGLVKRVTYNYSETRSITSAERVMFAWLTDLGWKPTLSSAGLLAKRIHQILEGQSFVLRYPSFLGLLEYMNGGAVNRNLTPARKADLSQDRDMSVAEAKNRLKGMSRYSDLHAYTTSKGIFRLGLLVQCPSCTRRSWFALDALGESLTCPRCVNPFSAVDNVDGGTWAYKTTGPFSVARYADGAYAVLLTLQCIAGNGALDRRTTPVLSFKAKRSNEDELEADFALFWQESLYGERIEGLAFGECKTYGPFDDHDFRRMRAIAKAFPGAVLVFSTLRNTLTSDEKKKIASIARRGRKLWKADRPINPVLVLTGVEVLGDGQMPYCWRGEMQEHYRHRPDLINLCDATQQIHLGLPSWRDDWNAEWQRKRDRRSRTPPTEESTESLPSDARSEGNNS